MLASVRFRRRKRNRIHTRSHQKYTFDMLTVFFFLTINKPTLCSLVCTFFSRSHTHIHTRTHARTHARTYAYCQFYKINFTWRILSTVEIIIEFLVCYLFLFFVSSFCLLRSVIVTHLLPTGSKNVLIIMHRGGQLDAKSASDLG